GLGFLLGSLPMLWRMPQLVASALPRQADFGELKIKLRAWAALYDGSYIERLMSSGGVFNDMYNRSSNAQSLLWIILPIAAVSLLAICFVSPRRRPQPVAGFLLLGFVLITLGIFALPGAVRIHHAFLAYPFPQLIIAAGFTFFWQRRSTRLVQAITRI